MSADLLAAVSAARTFLFVPGDRPERFVKAVASRADLVILDLEDAVAPALKPQARSDVAAALDAGIARGVRINARGSKWYEDDLAMVAQRDCMVVVPKAESSALSEVSARIGNESVIVALVETAAGILDSPAIARVPKVARLALGSFDLGAELGVSPDDSHALYASRSQLILASAAAGLAAPIDGVTAAVDNEEVLEADLQYGWRLGFTGKLCIHPRQVPTSSRILSPSPDEVAWAERVLGAVADADAAGVVVVDGQMVDSPVVQRASRVLARQQPAPDLGSKGQRG